MDTQRKRQRPSAKMQRALPHLIQALAGRSGRVNACKIADIAYSTFLLWLDTNPNFQSQIKKAEDSALLDGKEFAIAKIFKHMETQWTAAAWWLERKFPAEFARKDSGSQGYEGDRGKILNHIDSEVDAAAGSLEASPEAPEGAGGADAGL